MKNVGLVYAKERCYRDPNVSHNALQFEPEQTRTVMHGQNGRWCNIERSLPTGVSHAANAIILPAGCTRSYVRSCRTDNIICNAVWYGAVQRPSLFAILVGGALAYCPLPIFWVWRFFAFGKSLDGRDYDSTAIVAAP